MRGNFYISLENGEIRFVGDDLNWVNITELTTENITFTQEIIKQVLA